MNKLISLTCLRVHFYTLTKHSVGFFPPPERRNFFFATLMRTHSRPPFDLPHNAFFFLVGGVFSLTASLPILLVRVITMLDANLSFPTEETPTIQVSFSPHRR